MEPAAVFKGYFEEDEEEMERELTHREGRRRQAPVKRRDHFPVTYSGLQKVEGGVDKMIGPVEAKLIFVGNIATGGFKIQDGD